MHGLKLFLTSRQKLQEVTCQPQFLYSFAFGKAWIGKDKKGALGMEGNTSVFFYAISLIITRVLLLPQSDVASS